MALHAQSRKPLPGPARLFDPSGRMRRTHAELCMATEETLRELAFVYHAIRTVRTAMTGRHGSVSLTLD